MYTMRGQPPGRNLLWLGVVAVALWLLLWLAFAVVLTGWGD